MGQQKADGEEQAPNSYRQEVIVAWVFFALIGIFGDRRLAIVLSVFFSALWLVIAAIGLMRRQGLRVALRMANRWAFGWANWIGPL